MSPSHLGLSGGSGTPGLRCSKGAETLRNSRFGGTFPVAICTDANLLALRSSWPQLAAPCPWVTQPHPARGAHAAQHQLRAKETGKWCLSGTPAPSPTLPSNFPPGGCRDLGASPWVQKWHLALVTYRELFHPKTGPVSTAAKAFLTRQPQEPVSGRETDPDWCEWR